MTHSENIIIYTSLINTDNAKNASLSLSVRYSIYCTVFKEINTQYNISVCLVANSSELLWSRESKRERETEEKRMRKYFSRAEGCDAVCAIISDHCLWDPLIRQGKVNTLGWITDNNLQQSVDTTERDFLISMGYHVEIKCFPELLANCLGTRWRQNNLRCSVKRHFKNYDWGRWTLLSVCGLY